MKPKPSNEKIEEAQAIDRAVARVTRDMDRVDFSSDRRGALERREKVAPGGDGRRRGRDVDGGGAGRRRSRPAPRPRRRSAATRSGARCAPRRTPTR